MAEKGILDTKIGLDSKASDLIERLIKALEKIWKIGEGSIALAETIEELIEAIEKETEAINELRNTLEILDFELPEEEDSDANKEE